jgi:hypothetical protein
MAMLNLSIPIFYFKNPANSIERFGGETGASQYAP